MRPHHEEVENSDAAKRTSVLPSKSLDVRPPVSAGSASTDSRRYTI